MMGQNINTIALLVGDHDLTTGADTPHAAVYPLTRILIHAAFNMATSANDIALVYTASTVTFNYGISPACLPFPFTANTFAGHQVEALGWGTVDFGGPRVQSLRRVTLDVITNTVCRRSYGNLQGTQMCTFTPGKDTCQVSRGGHFYSVKGEPLFKFHSLLLKPTTVKLTFLINSHCPQYDSGGPVLWTNANTQLLYLVGITSAGVYCGSGPGINTRVTSYLSWIQANTAGTQFCRPVT